MIPLYELIRVGGKFYDSHEDAFVLDRGALLALVEAVESAGEFMESVHQSDHPSTRPGEPCSLCRTERLFTVLARFDFHQPHH